MRYRAKRVETWEQYRERIIVETQEYIEWGLNHPDQVVGIPTKLAEKGGFPKSVGEWFWATVLSDDEGSRLGRWRRRLLRRPKQLLQSVRLGGEN